ncbi:hypothetical protein EUTSA_v10022166mg, partial [Eutrema salsugineum]
MDTPEKNRVSAVSFCSFEDSPVFQYINGLSPIEPVKAEHADNILHSLDFASPSSLFSSPQMNSCRDSRFSIKRHRSLDLSSPVILLGENVKSSPDVLEGVKISGLCEEQLKCRPEQLENVSETKPFKEQVSLAIELANSLTNGKDGCDIRMVSCDEVATMDAEKEIGSFGSRKQSDELCRQPNELDADSDGVIQTEDLEAEIGSCAGLKLFDVAGIQNSEKEILQAKDPRFNSFTSAPQQLSICCNNSGNVVEPGGSSSVLVAVGVPDSPLSSSSNVAAIDSTANAEDKKEAGIQPSHKQRSVRRRCLTFGVGGSYKRIPLRDSSNDLPPDFTSLNRAPNPHKCLDSSKQDTDEILPIPRTIGLHLNSLVNPSVSSYQIKLISKEGCVLSHGEDECSTPVSTNRDLVSCDNKTMEKAPASSLEGEWSEELGSCKRCRCRKSKCLKLYCDCFAAGVYCIEPCSCQNCFNRPIHEDIVMKTRRMIEDRNPLAFAPKVISTSDSATDFGEESRKTPASARHTRGCNCKKSGCLKKYCECYLMGVGCSPSCRCIGCMNILDHTN